MIVVQRFSSLTRQTGFVVAIVAALYLAGCASVQPPAEKAPVTKKPDAKRAVSINADCSWKDENGYHGKMKLLAASNKVQDFSASVTHPKHGTCRFALTDFRQIQENPNVELKSMNSSCTVRMWRQGRQISVAFSSCKSMCSGDAVDYLWPILADANTGTCG